MSGKRYILYGAIIALSLNIFFISGCADTTTTRYNALIDGVKTPVEKKRIKTILSEVKVVEKDDVEITESGSSIFSEIASMYFGSEADRRLIEAAEAQEKIFEEYKASVEQAFKSYDEKIDLLSHRVDMLNRMVEKSKVKALPGASTFPDVIVDQIADTSSSRNFSHFTIYGTHSSKPGDLWNNRTGITLCDNDYASECSLNGTPMIKNPGGNDGGRELWYLEGDHSGVIECVVNGVNYLYQITPEKTSGNCK